MQLILLGTAGWMPQAERETACMAVYLGDRLVLLDAGTGLRRLVTDPGMLDGIHAIDVLLSHFHLDHVVGLTYLTALRSDLEVSVWGPGALLYAEPTWVILDRLIAPPFQPRSLTSCARVQDIPGRGLRIGDHEIIVREQSRHTAPTLAFRLDDVLCTDTAYDTDNASFSTGCRLLLHEAWCTGERGGRGHSSATEAARIAVAAQVNELLLIHLAPEVDEHVLVDEARKVFPAAVVALDLLQRELDQDDNGESS